LISILKTATELDRLEELRRAAKECYGLALRSVSQYAIEIDPHLTPEFRLHLEEIESQWAAAGNPRDMRAAQASFRGELREYRDKAREQLARLRKELEGAAAAMASFADGVASNSADCQEGLKRELKRLERMTKSSNLDEIRGGIRTSVGQISAGFDQLRRSDQLIIAQLQDEIRLLHQEFEAERRALFTDPASGAWTRQKLDLRFHDLLRLNDTFSVIVIAMRNLKALSQEYSRDVVEGALKAMLMRFRNAAGDDALIGRWNDDEFVMILEVDASAAAAIAAELEKNLGGPYTVQENGLARNITIQLAAGSLERAAGSDPAGFIRKLDQLTGSLSRDRTYAE
jgi:GGDEF domain-containing protein